MAMMILMAPSRIGEQSGEAHERHRQSAGDDERNGGTPRDRRDIRELGIYLPLITTNCAILALALFQTNRGYGFAEGLTFSIGAGAGLTLALTLMASLRERLELADVPAVARGAAIALIIASGLSLAFMGFAGLLTNP